MKTPIFRQVALDRLSSPEELDSLIQFTSIKIWLTLLGLAILLTMTVLWSIFGKLPTKLLAQQCILVKSGGVNSVTTAAVGRLSDLAVEAGDLVTRGQIIGRIEQIELLQKIKAAQARLSEVEQQYRQAQKLAGQSQLLRSATWQQQHQDLEAQLAAARQKSKLLGERVETQIPLLEQGLITKQTLISTQLELSASQLEAETIKSKLKQLDVLHLESNKQSGNEVVAAQNLMDEVKRSISLMQREARNSTQVVSPYTGRVVEVKAQEGQLLARGDALVSIETSAADRNEMEAYIYLPAADGKKIRQGMRVEISPTTAKREEYGFLPARITQVADYPSTDQGLLRVFGNEKMVQQLTGNLPPIQIFASLTPSARNASHYQWSTREGPPFQIQSGTLCSANITLMEQAPITLVLPILRKRIGFD